MKHYLITGRILGDDEDTINTCQAESRKWAYEDFLVALRDGMDEVEWNRIVSNGEVFVNGFYVSDTPIREVTIDMGD